MSAEVLRPLELPSIPAQATGDVNGVSDLWAKGAVREPTPEIPALQGAKTGNIPNECLPKCPQLEGLQLLPVPEHKLTPAFGKLGQLVYCTNNMLYIKHASGWHSVFDSSLNEHSTDDEEGPGVETDTDDNDKEDQK